MLKAPQTITFNAFPAINYGTPDFSPGASINSGLTISYTSSDTTVATIVSGKIHIKMPGVTTITASAAGNASYNAAAPVSQVLTIGKDSQTITFNAIPAKNTGISDFNPGAVASSGLPVTYTSSDTTVAKIIAGNIHIISTGNAFITASQPGNVDYSAATAVTQSLYITDPNKLAQTITFGALPAEYLGDADFNPGASSSASLPVSYTSSDTTIASIVAGNIHIKNVGAVTITASQTGNSQYNPALNISESLTINSKVSQSITFNSLAPVFLGNADINPGATASSGLPVTYTSSDTTVATIVNGFIHIINIGNVNIIASQPGNFMYSAAATITNTLTVNQVPAPILSVSGASSQTYLVGVAISPLTLNNGGGTTPNNLIGASFAFAGDRTSTGGSIRTRLFRSLIILLDLQLIKMEIFMLPTGKITLYEK